MDLELVSFKTCPYVQRSRITMLRKGVAHDVTYIDLADPPEWFQAISPLGKVPVLRVREGGREEVLFESAVINEFVDEVSAERGRLMPEDPIQRAKTRAWIEFGSQCLMDFYQSAMAADQEAYHLHLDALTEKLARLEEQVAGPFFFGETFTLADAALAPLMTRLDWFSTVSDVDLSGFPKLTAWRDALVSLPEVENSIVPEWRELQAEYIVAAESWLGRQLAVAA